MPHNHKLFLKKLIVSTESVEDGCIVEFSDSVNMIYGRNTSGKSSLIHCILYAVGINDVKQKLKELLDLDILVRIDFSIIRNNAESKYTFIRNDEFLVVIDSNGKKLLFNGIGADNSAEHVKLRTFWHDLLGSNFLLENNSGVGPAPIEALFLPYYVSQDVGWVYLRKSFANLDFYKSFKETYLDYFLGVDNQTDKQKRREIENEIAFVKEKIRLLSSIEKVEPSLVAARLSDESRPEIVDSYLEDYTNLSHESIRLEKDLIIKSNEISFWRERRSILSKIERNHYHQNEDGRTCPVCNQSLPLSIESEYKFNQEANDSESEIEKCKSNIKDLQSVLNSTKKKIEKLHLSLKSNHEILENRKENRTAKEWVDKKVLIELDRKITEDVGSFTRKLEELNASLGNFQDDDEILNRRRERAKRFKDLFLTCLSNIAIRREMDSRFYELYGSSSFPAQGVELHKIIIAYHFAFNFLIKEYAQAHRLPFFLDAIFKEDLEDVNKEVIMRFVSKWAPNDTQTIFSISDSKANTLTAQHYNSAYFSNKCNMILIGDGESERSLLKKTSPKEKEIMSETRALFEQD